MPRTLVASLPPPVRAGRVDDLTYTDRVNGTGRSWTALQVATVLILTVGTAGWVVPAYRALSLHMTAVGHALAGAAGHESLPWLEEAQRMARLAAIWLFAVLFVWGFLGARRLLLPTRRERRDR